VLSHWLTTRNCSLLVLANISAFFFNMVYMLPCLAFYCDRCGFFFIHLVYCLCYVVSKSSFPILSQTNPVYTTLSYLSKILLSTLQHLGCPSGLFPSGSPTNNLYTPFSPIHVTCPAHLILLNLIILIILGKSEALSEFL
jgi:hypothetical protein